MEWTTIFQIGASILYCIGAIFSIMTGRTNQKASAYWKSWGSEAKQTMADWRFVHDQQVELLHEEIALLKENKGLYSLKDDNEKYQTYLALLRKK